MKKIPILLLIFVTCFSLHGLDNVKAKATAPTTKKQLTPTEKYLQDFPVETILIGSHAKYLPFFNNLIVHEDRTGFFGYHGHSQQYRIFQDILKSVFTESLGYDIPKDFQFLRIPDEEIYNLIHTKESFYKKFDRKVTSQQKEQIIKLLFIQPFTEKYEVTLTQKEIQQLQEPIWSIFEEFLLKLDLLSREEYYSQDSLITPHILQWANHQEGYDAENGNHYFEEENQIENKFAQKIETIMDIYYFSDLSNDTSHFIQEGAHANSSSSLYQIYEKLLNSKKKSTASLKAWVASHYDFSSLLSKVYAACFDSQFGRLERVFFPFDDTDPPQQTLLLAMNVPLFGNFHRWDECSFIIFGNNHAISFSEGKGIALLENFFSKIGLKSSLVKEMEKAAVEELKAQDVKSGCILQFFDTSGDMAKGINKCAYVSHSWGIPFKEVPATNVVSGKYPLRNHSMDLQLRLVMSNYTTLNPYSFLRMTRHETLNEDSAQKILDKMRDILKSNPPNKEKILQYKEKMNQIWKISH